MHLIKHTKSSCVIMLLRMKCICIDNFVNFCFSMLAAEQRLKDAGYGDKTMLYQPEDDNGEEHQMKVIRRTK